MLIVTLVRVSDLAEVLSVREEDNALKYYVHYIDCKCYIGIVLVLMVCMQRSIQFMQYLLICLYDVYFTSHEGAIYCVFQCVLYYC